MSVVKFEKVTEYKEIDFELPKRSTKYSAGYDFVVPEDIIIPSFYSLLIKTISAKVKSPKFIKAFAQNKAAKTLADLSEMVEDPMTGAAKQEVINQFQENLPLLIELIKDQLVVDLDELKDLTKAADSRMTLVPTGVKAYLKENQKLELFVRSSSAVGAYLTMGNNTGIVDSDYVDNKSNEGHIAFPIINLSPFDIRIKKGEVIGQGIISSYDKTDDDLTEFERIGGFGSTDEDKIEVK